MTEFDVEKEITFSEYSPCDHSGFLDCINDFYRGGYPYPDYLEKENIDMLVRSGDMIVTVAKNKDGRIVGTSAARKLSGIFAGSVLLLLRCVVSDYQRRGIASKQEVFLFECIDREYPDVISLYADVMTHDAISQSTLCKQGFTFCGFRMMLYKNEIICPKIHFEEETKMSQAIFCRKYSEKKAKIFLPDEQRDFISKIYSDLGADYEILPNKNSNDEIQYSFETTALHNSAEIFVKFSGTENSEKLFEKIDELLDDYYTCVCYINICQAGAVEIYNRLKKKGFVFTGVKPLSTNGEYLVMSHIKNCKVNFENIKFTPNTEQSAKYIFGGFKYETH